MRHHSRYEDTILPAKYLGILGSHSVNSGEIKESMKHETT